MPPPAGLEPGPRPRARARTLGSGDGPLDPGSDSQIRGRTLRSGDGPSDPVRDLRIRGRTLGSRNRPSDPGTGPRIHDPWPRERACCFREITYGLHQSRSNMLDVPAYPFPKFSKELYPFPAPLFAECGLHRIPRWPPLKNQGLAKVFQGTYGVFHGRHGSPGRGLRICSLAKTIVFPRF